MAQVHGCMEAACALGTDLELGAAIPAEGCDEARYWRGDGWRQLGWHRQGAAPSACYGGSWGWGRGGRSCIAAAARLSAGSVLSFVYKSLKPGYKACPRVLEAPQTCYK